MLGLVFISIYHYLQKYPIILNRVKAMIKINSIVEILEYSLWTLSTFVRGTHPMAVFMFLLNQNKYNQL